MTALFACAGFARVIRAEPALEIGNAVPSAAFWPTLTAVQAHLFPATQDSPGAADINAGAYLKAVLVDPKLDQEEQAFITNGVGLLDHFTREQKQAPFFDLTGEQREELLRRIETTPVGQYWLSLILYYIFEALLSDPVYGGNPDRVGWRWLEHQPGFPRPPVGHRYQAL